MNNMYCWGKIEKEVVGEIDYIWVGGNEDGDFMRMKGFGKGVKEEINNVFRELVVVVGDKGLMRVDVEYMEGSKIEWKGKKYSFVWGKRVEGKGRRVMDKMGIVLEEVDERIGEEKCIKERWVEFSWWKVCEIVDEVKEGVEGEGGRKDKEEKKGVGKKKKEVREVEGYGEKVIEYENEVDRVGEGKWYWKRDGGGRLMGMKEDGMKKGERKGGYNVEIGSEKEFMRELCVFGKGRDRVRVIGFLECLE